MLVKYCEKQHNVNLGCNTIKLGTLKEYRENYPGFVIADPEEGVAGVGIAAGEKLEVTAKDAGRLPFADGVKSGAIYFVAPSTQNGYVVQEFPNSYVFCMSDIGDSQPSAEQAKNLDPDYNSAYSLEEAQIRVFAEILKTLLLAQIKIEDFEERAREQYLALPISNQVVMCNYFAKRVEYGETKVPIVKTGETKALRPLDERVDESIFRKTMKDVSQNEFRFAFILRNPLIGVIPVKKDAVLLQLSPLFSLLSSHSL